MAGPGLVVGGAVAERHARRIDVLRMLQRERVKP
jgi:hypothetical protein